MKVYSAGAIIVALLTISTSTKAFATPTFHVLYNFSGWSDGRGPSSTLILNRSGIVYGTTENGGDTTGQGGCSNRSGCGVVFKIDTTGHETVIHTFEGSPTDGEGPRAGLVRDAHGDLFGTTTAGGATNSGVVFMITPRGKEKILYSFCPNFPSCPDGRTPFSGLIFDAAGDLLGTTVGGGVDSGNCGGSNTYGCGVVYSINPSGQESVVYSFLGAPTDGMGPFDALTADATGDLYGTTRYGGDTSTWCSTPNWGCGTVFKISPERVETIVHMFCCGGGQGDGIFPFSKLTADSAGDLYGTTIAGGSNNLGIVFEIGPNGAESIVHSFSYSEGAAPFDLVRDGGGNFAGMTNQGGSNAVGTVFEVKPNGKLIVLHTFGGSDGSTPFAGLVRDAAGDLFGATQQGGLYGQGVVFELSP